MHIQSKKIQFYDSMGSTGKSYLTSALRYLGHEAQKLGNNDFNPSDWELVSTEAGTPQQENGFDCGVFTITYADFITDDLPLSFTQDQMPLFRTKICANILHGSLKYPV